MQEGIYHVRFSSPQGTSGEGLAVIKDGAVNGGDGGYLYQGQLAATGDQVAGQLEIKQWNHAVPSIFGPVKQFTLDLHGSAKGETFAVSGVSVPGTHVEVLRLGDEHGVHLNFGGHHGIQEQDPPAA